MKPVNFKTYFTGVPQPKKGAAILGGGGLHFNPDNPGPLGGFAARLRALVDLRDPSYAGPVSLAGDALVAGFDSYNANRKVGKLAVSEGYALASDGALSADYGSTAMFSAMLTLFADPHDDRVEFLSPSGGAAVCALRQRPSAGPVGLTYSNFGLVSLRRGEQLFNPDPSLGQEWDFSPVFEFANDAMTVVDRVTKERLIDARLTTAWIMVLTADMLLSGGYGVPATLLGAAVTTAMCVLTDAQAARAAFLGPEPAYSRALAALGRLFPQVTTLPPPYLTGNSPLTSDNSATTRLLVLASAVFSTGGYNAPAYTRCTPFVQPTLRELLGGEPLIGDAPASVVPDASITASMAGAEFIGQAGPIVPLHRDFWDGLAAFCVRRVPAQPEYLQGGIAGTATTRGFLVRPFSAKATPTPRFAVPMMPDKQALTSSKGAQRALTDIGDFLYHAALASPIQPYFLEITPPW